MFVEVNRIGALVMDLSGGPPVGVPLEAWIQAVAPWPAVIFVPEASKEYERMAPLALIREGNPAQLYANMAFPVRAAVKSALKELGLPPCECVFVSSSPRAVVQAAGAHVGTVLLAPRGPMDELPDFIVESPDELQGVLRGDIGGYLGELEAACHAFDGFPRPKYALLALVSRPALDSLGVKAVATGRYFASADHRYRKHPLTRYILDAKSRLLDRPGRALVAALASCLKVLQLASRIDAVTRVPPRPGRYDHLDPIVRRACAELDIPYDRTMLRCVSDYPKQRDSAGATRAENVRGRFCAIAGSHQRVVLVDDIITSGNTAAECSKVLLEAGCEEVRVVALAVDQNDYVEHRAGFCCPTCGSPMILKVRSRDGSGALFWGCGGWPQCRQAADGLPGLRAENAAFPVDAIEDDIEVVF